MVKKRGVISLIAVVSVALLCGCSFSSEEADWDTEQIIQESVLDYSGLYVDTQGTSDIYSELELVYQEKGVYEATIGLYRLTTLEGTARVEGDKLLFEDEGMQVKGEIFFRDGGAVFRATESEFTYITVGEEFVFPEKRER